MRRKKIVLSVLTICGVLGFGYPYKANAQEVLVSESNVLQESYTYKVIPDEHNSSEDMIIYDESKSLISIDSFGRATSSKSFAYDFKNILNVNMVFPGKGYSKIKFDFTTTAWSNSNKFYVNCYEESNSDGVGGTLISQKAISKSSGNPSSVTFSLDSTSKSYYFKLENSVYGQQIVGSGKWTVTSR